MDDRTKCRLTGGAAGMVNGMFGGGGGMVLVPLLMHRVRMSEKETFATSVAVILPICAVSLAAHMLQSGLVLFAALPYMAGGAAGGLLGGRLFEKVSSLWLRRVFGAFVLYAAWKYLA
jgi:uncharacterized membrane protein YfcA